MDRHEESHTALTIALLRGLYLDIIMNRHEGHQSALTIALIRGLYLAIISDRYEGPKLPYYRLDKRTLPIHYNTPS
jgi:hypothetical protein